jgi:signal transduction histidine kinase
VEVSVILDDRRPAAVEVATYYLVCEALTDIAKYANADSAIVRVTMETPESVLREVLEVSSRTCIRR